MVYDFTTMPLSISSWKYCERLLKDLKNNNSFINRMGQ